MEEFLSSLGRVSAIIGAQWGDEGKGKATDLLAEHFDVIARACGGANAGHTIIIDGTKHVFHLLPSGCLHEGKPVVLGAGMVIHLPTLLEEISVLKEAGIDILPRLWIAPAAHVIFDFHKEIDAATEEEKKARGTSIGTTKRGIGPAYADKANRIGIRMERLGDDVRAALEQRSTQTERSYGVKIDVRKETDAWKEAAGILKNRVTDIVSLLHDAYGAGKSILIEGAQGALLDLDHGTYPYVTSSFTTVAGALQGLGLPPSCLTSCIGIAKAYCTRVGGGAFPAEAEPEAAERLRKRGGEFGATTGRPRRCGWLSLDDLRRVARINGITHWNITKLDVLDEENIIPVATETKGGGAVYDEHAGWNSSTLGLTSFDQLPQQAQAYLTFIETQTGVPVSLIGTGPDRKHMITRPHPPVPRPI